MDIKKLAKALLYPRIPIVILLTPISIVLLVGSMVFVGTESPIAIISYVLSAYTLTVWCFRMPAVIRFFVAFKNENKYAVRWQEDTRLRMKVSLYGTLIFNTVYALFQLWLGFYHHTFWYYSLAGYYISLAIMRFSLARHTSNHLPGEKMREELIKYRTCGWIFLIMNLALTLIIFFMVYWDRTFIHHEITTIAMAAYTFAALTLAIINVIKYRKYKSPVYTASKIISLAAACVSMLTLESTMLTTFGGDTMTATDRRLMLALSGGAISVFILVMAVYMIKEGTKTLKALNTKEETNDR